jgi:cellulose synthase/poly-beta-1,6-N-acetylglucosamine synthase-like glycosyltransferase
MLMMQIFFWCLAGLLFYSYIGYSALLACVLAISKKNKTDHSLSNSKVSIIIPAYNEELFLKRKLENISALNYPKELLQVIVVTDGSTDQSNKIVETFPFVQLLFINERNGKAAAINRAMQFVVSSYVIFSDADTILNENAVQLILSHYQNERVGGVACEKRIFLSKNNAKSNYAEGLYWQYESFIKQMESEVHSVIGAAGEFFSIKTNLFETIPEDTILDDFMISSIILKKGFRFVYEKNAIAVELPTVSLKEEAKRKIRIAAGAAQTFFRLGIWPYQNSWLNIQYLSRRVIRWVISPIALIFIFVFNYILININQLYHWFFIIQVLFYFFSAIGYIFYLFKIRSGILLAPMYFVFMNACMLIGFIKYFTIGQSVNWKKAERTAI